jgi:hypothetical protein
MKISEIKSDEVRKEAVRLAKSKDVFGTSHTDNQALRRLLIDAFTWHETKEGLFWANLNNGLIPNLHDLKLPEKNPSE